jgi:hypothetical protein
MMLELNSKRWRELSHAYGSAGDIPALLSSLKADSSSIGNEEPWFSLWSSLAHQGDVYTATFAAVPHIVSILSSDPIHATFSFFQFPTWVEICRQRNGIEIPADLKQAYQASIALLPECVAKASSRNWDASSGGLACALAAVAIGCADSKLAAAVLELTPDVLIDFEAWFESR